MSNREELAWAAGFFDGEGCVSANRKGYPQIVVGQADPEPLHRLKDAVGAGTVYGPYPHGLHKPIWTYRATNFEAVQHVVAVLWGWLGSAKKEQARRVLQGVPISKRRAPARYAKTKVPA